MASRLFLIDGLSQIFRCYYAPFPDLNAPDGEPTRATYVFTQMLLQLIRQQKPDYLAMVMDSAEEQVFRKQIDPQYKANREPPPEDLPPQIIRILDIVASQSIPVLSKPGFEADDLIATLCTRLADQELDIVIVSKDKDLDQLLSERVSMFDPGKSEFIGPDQLRARKGYGPDKAIEIQCLTGDTTDNIPGVKGVGPKKAADLIARYGSAAAVIDHAAELTPAMRQNVLAFAPCLETTRSLVSLRRDIPLDFELEACRWQGFDVGRLEALFRKLGFKRLLDQLPQLPAVARPSSGMLFSEEVPAETRAVRLEAASRNYTLVDTEDAFRKFLDQLRQQPRFAFDTETTHINPAWADLVGLSFSWCAGCGFYLPVRGVGRVLPLEPTLAGLRPIMADPKVSKTGQNLKYDLAVLARYDVPVANAAFDTMIASFVLDSSRRSHGMDALAQELLGITPIPITDLIGKGKLEITFDKVDTAKACEYAAEDADVTWALGEVLGRQLAASDVQPLFRDTEMPLVEVLAAMESEGVRLDTEFLRRMSEQLGERLAELTRQIHDVVSYAFNIDSPKQLARILFDELKLAPVKKTKTGASTDAETLETLVWQTNHPLPKLVLEYRELVKLKGTYVDTLPSLVCPRTGRVHGSFHQTVAVTGRLSSSDPNLQNIPIRTELGRQIRRAFLARDAEHVLLAADYSQIELRVLAHFCKDHALIEAFSQDRDIHQFVAGQVFGVPLEQVSKDQRSRAKAVNFGIIYGQTAYGLSRTTGMPVPEAQNFIDMYFLRYPGIRRFIDDTVARARSEGFVRTILGRRRAVPNINSHNRGLRSAAERLAVNTVIQGSAADLIKKAMIGIHRGIRRDRRPMHMIIQVHDELVFDVRRDVVEEQAEFVRQAMCTALPLEVPIKVDITWADNWLKS